MNFFFAKKNPVKTDDAKEPPHCSQLTHHVQPNGTGLHALTKRIAYLLSKTIESNRSKIEPDDIYTSQRVPLISIEAYLLRFMIYLFRIEEANLSEQPDLSVESVYIIMLILLNTFFEKHSNKHLSMLNVHRLLACSFLFTHKFNFDIPRSNSFISKCDHP